MTRTPSSLLLSLSACLVFAATLSAQDALNWNKSAEAYFMTPAERAEWAKVLSPGDAQKFIDEYFRKRGPQFGKDVRTRIDLADKEFKLDRTPGAQTQRGRVWILLGPPSRMTTNRQTQDTRGLGSTGVFQGRTIERQGLIVTDWIYDADRLPAELGRKSLTVRFQTDSARGYEVIDNVGVVEPYLTAAAEYVSNKYIAGTPIAPTPVVPGATLDPLWNAAANPNGAVFVGEAFLSPREEPFYAYSFYIPKGTASFADWKSGLLVTLVRDASGQQVVSQRQPVDLVTYDDAGNRYLDRSVALAPGKYEGMFALYTPDGATLLSSHRTMFEVPAKETPRASALLLTSRIDTLEKQDAFDPFTFVATKYAVRGDRQFRISDKIGFFTVLSNPSGSPAPKLKQKMIFRRDGKDFARTPLEDAQLTQTGPNTFLLGTLFDPDTFQIGHYSLELQIRDANAPDGKGYVLTTEFDVK